MKEQKKKKAKEDEKTKKIDPNYSDLKSQNEKRAFNALRNKKEKQVHLATGKTETFMWTGKIRGAFLTHLFCRLLVEILFFVIMFYIAGRSNGFDKIIPGHPQQNSTVGRFLGWPP